MTTKKKTKKKARKKHKPWGSGRNPIFKHLKKTAMALGMVKFDDANLRLIAQDQSERDPESFLPSERGIHAAYVRFMELTPRGKKGFMTQLKGFWEIKKKIRTVRVPPPAPPPKILITADTKVPPPPPPNAISAKKPPPPPPNAVGVKPTLVEQFARDFDRHFIEKLPLEELGTIYGETPPSPGVEGHKNKVCISVRFRRPQDQDEIIQAIQSSIQGYDPFSAAIMEAKHFRTPTGIWVDLLIYYSCPVVDLYRLVMKCELVLETHAKPADDFGEVRDAR